MAYQKIQRDLDLSESIINIEPSVKYSLMRVVKSFFAACVLSMVKTGCYLSFDRTQSLEQILANKRHTLICAGRCLVMVSLFTYLSYLLFSSHHLVFDVQRIGLLFDYIVP